MDGQTVNNSTETSFEEVDPANAISELMAGGFSEATQEHQETKPTETEAKAEVEQAIQSEAKTEEQVQAEAPKALSIDPNQLVSLPNGTTVPWHEVVTGSLIGAKAKEREVELQKATEELTRDKQLIEQAKGWLDLANKDVGASVYLVTLKDTGDPVKALKAAQEASGVTLTPQAPAVPQKPQPGTPEYYLQDRPEDLEPGSTEYDQWYAKHLYHVSHKGAQDAIEAERKRSQEAETKKLETEREEQRKRNESETQSASILSDNSKMLSNTQAVMFTERKFDSSKLSVDQQRELGKALTSTAQALGYNVTDQSWLSSNRISENDLRLIVLKTNLDSFTERKAVPQIPSLVQPKVEVLPNPPISAGPAATNGVPTDGSMREDDGVIGAIGELLASAQ